MGIEEMLKVIEDKEHISEIIRSLPPEKRVIVYYHFVEELTYKEIGQLLGKSEQNVKMIVCRIRKELKVLEAQEHLLDRGKF